MSTCPCGRRFGSPGALQQHQWATRHCFCKECDRSFRTDQALEQHCSALHCFNCPGCNNTYTTEAARQLHQRSKGHCYCGQCDRFFSHPGALEQHLRSSVHATQFHCCDCDRDFVNEHALGQHLTDKVHYRERRANPHCQECGRQFESERALQQHLSSVAHNPLGNIKCIGHSSCKKQFNCPSAMLHHLESGSCSSGMTRQKLNSLVQSQDDDRVITSASDVLSEGTMLAFTPLPSSSERSIMFTPSSGGTSRRSSVMFTPNSSSMDLSLRSTGPRYSSGLLTPQSDSLNLDFTDLPYSRLSTACPLCPARRKPFGSLQALHTHLSSAVHAPLLYHCPVSLFSPSVGGAAGAIKHFSTLSGLTQHIESGACKGGKVTLRRAIRFVEEKLSPMGSAQMWLLK